MYEQDEFVERPWCAVNVNIQAETPKVNTSKQMIPENSLATHVVERIEEYEIKK